MTTVPPEKWPLPVDPRLRARRQAVLRSEGRRRLRRLGVVAAGAGVGLTGWLLALSPLLDVDQVVVRGAERSGPEVVREATGVAPGEAMVTLGLGRAVAAVEALPWVATATAERRWPGTVVVSVVERRPVATVSVAQGEGAQGGPRWMLVDDQGRLLAFVEEPPPELARIDGTAQGARPGAEVGPAVAGALELLTRLQEALPGPPPGVAVGPGGALEAVVWAHDGTERRVQFGEPVRLADKVLALRTLVEHGALDEAAPGVVVDVRVPEAPVLTDRDTDLILSTVTRGLHNSKSHVEVEGSAPQGSGT
ncbi:MAG: FtsQ-type POTRA domain-containing protein [Actinobacteria bacterium]|nr:FtsQ-type POTRA domain-containing protein [Actinomycetota bacterium]